MSDAVLESVAETAGTDSNTALLVRRLVRATCSRRMAPGTSPMPPWTTSCPPAARQAEELVHGGVGEVPGAILLERRANETTTSDAVLESVAAVSATDSNTALARFVRLVRATLGMAPGTSPTPPWTSSSAWPLRLVGSSLSASVEPDENAAADAIRRRLNRVAAGGAAGIQFADLHRRLSQQPGLRSRWAPSSTLLQIAEDNETHASDPAAAVLVHPLSASAAAGRLRPSATTNPTAGRPAPLAFPGG